MDQLMRDVVARIRDVPDFPKPGILFKDITPVLNDTPLFRRIVRWMGEDWGAVDKVVGIESRGFLFGAALVQHIDAGFVPARKQGKLPWHTRAVEYELEYGTATLEIHLDGVQSGERVLIVDDLLATGGTASATADLVRQLGGDVVGFCFLVELDFLEGRKRLDSPVRSLVHY